MPVNHELAVGRQPFQWFALENALIRIEVVENPGIENEEAGVGPPVGLRFLGEPRHATVFGDGQHAEPEGGCMAVTVARRPWERWNFSSSSISTSDTPSP